MKNFSYEKFLVDHIKVGGKTGQLGEDVKISRDVPGQLAVTSSIPFSKVCHKLNPLFPSFEN